MGAAIAKTPKRAACAPANLLKIDHDSKFDYKKQRLGRYCNANARF